MPTKTPTSKLTIATVGGIVAMLGILGPGIAWFFDLFETSSNAKLRDLGNRQRDAWASYNVARLETLVLRNRVNECDEKQESGNMTPTAVAACRDYRREYETAATRSGKLFEEARALSNEQHFAK